MIDCTKYALNGRIEQIMTLLDETEADQNGPWVSGHWDGETHFVYSGQIAVRAKLDAPASATVATGTALVIPDLPEGTEIEVDGERVMDENDKPIQVDETNTLHLTIDIPGVWPVKLDPPFPFLPVVFEVTTL